MAMSIAAVAIATERFCCFSRTRFESYPDKKELEMHLIRRLHAIATVGSNAFYMGLLDAILGIMLTFASIGQLGLADTPQILSPLLSSKGYSLYRNRL